MFSDTGARSADVDRSTPIECVSCHRAGSFAVQAIAGSRNLSVPTVGDVAVIDMPLVTAPSRIGQTTIAPAVTLPDSL